MADVSNLIAYYQKLLIKQYQGQPNAVAHIGLLAQAALMDGLPIDILNGFNINPALGPTAVGAQLDIVGKYVGASRSGYSFSGPMKLNDADYLKLIQLKVIRNISDSGFATIQNFLNAYFPGTIQVFDHFGMRMSYFFEATLGSQQLAEFFVKSGFLPKPMGVQNAVVTYAPNVNAFFGFSTTFAPGFNVSPFNSVASYQTTWPWLSVSQGIEE
jgi:hypothetical protein